MASIQTAIQIQSSLASIGSPPVEESQVKGGETDSLVTGVGNSWLYMAAFIAIVSAGKRLWTYAHVWMPCSQGLIGFSRPAGTRFDLDLPKIFSDKHIPLFSRLFCILVFLIMGGLRHICV